ncbi:3bf1fdc9-1d96-4e6f-9358-09dedb8e0082 [Sclerotinia trifoliorum]|uniref:3bf1fdc9-1d96-4e6f-9358-09dedb8e0082 n=1 Tax=Sclerotinia trifoliorum TaxID=28548 RepID=A0A8H2VWN8_9HELO|nr:3bf1fdc9-1d96-4e6f-9358-09dedb8e0082 [Sclerotinia trifoliorum]
MKFTAISICLLVALTFSDGALGYASPHVHRRALGSRASNNARSIEVPYASNAPAPTPPALFPSQNNTNNDTRAPKLNAQLTLSAIPANTTTVFVSSTSTGPAPTGTTASIGGIQPPNIERTTDPDRPYSVNGDKFTDIEDAVERACAIQHNSCADAINNGALSDAEISDCDDQLKTCVAAT